MLMTSYDAACLLRAGQGRQLVHARGWEDEVDRACCYADLVAQGSWFKFLLQVDCAADLLVLQLLAPAVLRNPAHAGPRSGICAF